MSVASGVYYIRNIRSGTVIDLKGATGTTCQGLPKRPLSDPLVPGQFWVVYKVAGSTYTIENTRYGTFLDLQNGTNGAPIKGVDPSNSSRQKWVITQVPGQSYYTIRNVAHGKFVDLDIGGPSSPITKIQGWTGIPGNPNQQWYFDHV